MNSSSTLRGRDCVDLMSMAHSRTQMGNRHMGRMLGGRSGYNRGAMLPPAQQKPTEDRWPRTGSGKGFAERGRSPQRRGRSPARPLLPVQQPARD